MKQILVILLIAGVLGGVSYWYFRPEDPIPKFLTISQPTSVELYAEGIKRRTFDEQGQLESTVSASTLSQLDAAGNGLVDQPLIVLYENQQPKWQISSLVADLKADGITQFQQDVEIRSLVGWDENWKLNTDLLTFDPERKYAYTEHPVTMSSTNGQLTAIGMELDLTAEIVEFKADVNAVYDPN